MNLMLMGHAGLAGSGMMFYVKATKTACYVVNNSPNVVIAVDFGNRYGQANICYFVLRLLLVTLILDS